MLSVMSRRTPTRLGRSGMGGLVIAVSGVLILAGCSSHQGSGHAASKGDNSVGSDSGGANSAREKVLQTRYSTSDPTLRMDIMGLGRSAKNTLRLRIRVTNVTAGSVILQNQFANRGEDFNNFEGLSLIDGKHLERYYPEQRQGGGLMSHPSNLGNIGSLGKGKSFEATIYYPAPPKNVKKIDVQSHTFPTFSDIPIAPSAPRLPSDPDPAAARMKPPHTAPLISRTDNLNGNQSVDNNGGKVDVRLSTDVLFKLNKANLTSKAHSILKSVAKRIDSSKAKTIKIDGYTDSSGNDAINNPLSKRRANSVKKELQKQVTRSGISYQTAGHGSSDPVASNGSKDGRKKNRRVTVTLGK